MRVLVNKEDYNFYIQRMMNKSKGLKLKFLEMDLEIIIEILN